MANICASSEKTIRMRKIRHSLQLDKPPILD